MSLRLYSLIFGILLFQGLQAQALIMIGDETKTGFKLVANGYLQNEVYLEKMNFKGFPAGETELYFALQDGRSFKKSLPNLPKGNHQYFIVENFGGQLKLRYRGKHESIGQSALLFDYNEDQAFPFPDRPVASVAEKLPEIPEPHKAPKIKLDSSEATEGKPLKERPAKVEESSAESRTDSLVVQSAPTEEAKTKPEPAVVSEAKPFEETILQIETSNFEFDKLSLSKQLFEKTELTEEQLSQLLKSFKYDQSRLDLLATYREKHPDIALGKELIKCFDYELSKIAAQKIIDGTKD